MNLLKLFGGLHYESLENENLTSQNLLNALESFENKSCRDKEADLHELYKGLDARSKREVRERYVRIVYLMHAASPPFQTAMTEGEARYPPSSLVCSIAEKLQSTFMHTDSSPQARLALDAIPDEMIIQICEFADSRSLTALRATCRRIRHWVEEPFRLAHFSERRHILSRHSLEELFKITAHPVFVRYVRSIKLGSCRLSPGTFQNLDILDNDPLPGASEDLKLLRDDIYLTISEQENLERFDYRADLEVQNLAVLWIKNALNNIRGWGNIPEIGTYVDVSKDSSATDDPTYFMSSESDMDPFYSGFGCTKAYGTGSNAVYMDFDDRPYATTTLLLRAVHASNCSIERLSLSVGLTEESTSFWMIDEPEVGPQLSSLRSLTTNAYPLNSGTNYFTIRLIERLMTHAPNMVEWDLGGVNMFWGTTDLISILSNINLHTWRLSYGIDAYVPHLINALGTQQQTLRNLSLKSLWFVDIDQVRTLLSWIQSHLCLNTLFVADIKVPVSEEEPDVPEEELDLPEEGLDVPVLDGPFEYNGVREVREGLKEILKMLDAPGDSVATQ